jgi:hypothetical protein
MCLAGVKIYFAVFVIPLLCSRKQQESESQPKKKIKKKIPNE